jgi:4'-phosphopantetheinyl transferase
MPTNRHWPQRARPSELATDEVHAWTVPLTVSQQAHDDLLAMLAPEERARANDYRFDVPKRRYVIARGTLRRLLGEYLDLAPASIELAVDQNQKPLLADKHAGSDLHFNVSHSGDLAMIGFARGCEIGIDVEELREVSHLEQIARRFFHPSETSRVLTCPTSAQSLAFLRCWTGKEAILKAVGIGILGNLADFQVPAGDEWRGWIECSTSLQYAKRARCWLEQLAPCDNYLAAIACVESKRTVCSYLFAM